MDPVLGDHTLQHAVCLGADRASRGLKPRKDCYALTSEPTNNCPCADYEREGLTVIDWRVNCVRKSNRKNSLTTTSMKSILLSVLALSLVPYCELLYIFWPSLASVSLHYTIITYTAGLSQLATFGANYTPSIGTVVAGLPGTNHTFNCDQFSSNNNVTTKITTAWLLDNFLGLSLVSIRTNDHPEFAITGTERGSDFPFPTFRNQLTIVNLTHRLHNVRLFCGHGQNTDGYWELRVYSECVCVCVCVCVRVRACVRACVDKIMF